MKGLCAYLVGLKAYFLFPKTLVNKVHPLVSKTFYNNKNGMSCFNFKPTYIIIIYVCSKSIESNCYLYYCAFTVFIDFDFRS